MPTQEFLHGRFIQSKIKSQPGNVLATWLATYDTQAKAYRTWYFSSQGALTESLGQWDARTRTLTWKSSPQPGITSTARWHFTDDDTVEWDLLARDGSGKRFLDMHGKLVRQK